MLALIAVLLIVAQGYRSGESQKSAERAMSQMGRQVSAIYEMQLTFSKRPTQDDLNAASGAVYLRSRDVQLHPGLKADTALLSAQIMEFVLRRSRQAPPINTAGAGDALWPFLDRVTGPPLNRRLTDDERLDEATKLFLVIVPDPLGEVGLTPAEKRWFRANQPGIAYYYETQNEFARRFAARLDSVLGRLQTVKAVDSDFVFRARINASRNDLGMREVALMLGDAANRLP